jgi:hypothetical protein
MKAALRLLSKATLCMAALLALSPLALYTLGLSGIEGRPKKPSQIASRQLQLSVWNCANGLEPAQIAPETPYSLAWSLAFNQPKSVSASERVLWWVASDYLTEHQQQRSMGWWHLSGAALSVWLSRNWTTEELLSAAALALANRGLASTPDASQCRRP